MRPPQPAELRWPVDQLMTPMMTPPAKAGPPLSPLQAPRPGRSLCVDGSTRRIRSPPGDPVAISRALRKRAAAARVLPATLRRSR